MIALLLAVSALHAGFQAVVTVVVYPALVSVPQEQWREAHDGHSRRISYLVVPLYLALLVVCPLALLSEDAGPAVLAAALGAAAAGLLTALVAAPTHGALGREGPRPDLLRRLLLSDRARCAAAFLGLVGAGFAAVG